MTHVINNLRFPDCPQLQSLHSTCFFFPLSYICVFLMKNIFRSEAKTRAMPFFLSFLKLGVMVPSLRPRGQLDPIVC